MKTPAKNTKATFAALNTWKKIPLSSGWKMLKESTSNAKNILIGKGKISYWFEKVGDKFKSRFRKNKNLDDLNNTDLNPNLWTECANCDQRECRERMGNELSHFRLRK